MSSPIDPSDLDLERTERLLDVVREAARITMQKEIFLGGYEIVLVPRENFTEFVTGVKGKWRMYADSCFGIIPYKLEKLRK